MADYRIIEGDCLDVLPTLADGSVDAVVTDPPYIIGATSVGNSASKCGTWYDMKNAAYWFGAWYAAAWRTLKETGYLVTCCNWRSLPTVICGLADQKIPATSCMVWDKEWIGPAYRNALRPTYEMVVFAAKPTAVIPNRSASDVFRCRWMAGNCKTTDHPAEKPVKLMAHLVELVTTPGALVLDPFCGSGSTGVACLNLGRRFIGIEQSPEYCAIARRRLDGAIADRPLLAPV